MKKVFVVTTLIFITSSVFALDNFFAGVSAEANANTREGVAAGGGFTFGIDMNQHIAFGVKTTFSHDFDTVSNLETAAFFRYYLPLPVHGLFLQAEAGGSFFFEDSETFPVFLGGLTAGWRFVFADKFYLEPSVCGGYPFKWGAGLTVGLRFYSRRDAEAQREELGEER